MMIFLKLLIFTTTLKPDCKVKCYKKNMGTILLKLPIKIRPTVQNDGYVITDASDTEYFFYNQKNKEELIYDGFCTASKPLTETENNDD